MGTNHPARYVKGVTMKGADKFLVGIVAGVALLVVAAFVVALLRPEPTYRPEDTPEGVAHNYLLALGQEDYARAYRYLSPAIAGYPPSAEAFAEDVHDNEWNFRLNDSAVTLEVVSARVTGNRAVVSVRERQFYEGGLFGSGEYTSTFEMTLTHDPAAGAWMIVESDTYWAWCWEDEKGCR
jgi:hypothetical protein